MWLPIKLMGDKTQKKKKQKAVMCPYDREAGKWDREKEDTKREKE